jgi:PAS domain S-box-containing protein
VTKRREEAEQRYRRLFEAAKDAMVVIDAETEIIRDVNPHLVELTGYPREEFVGRKVSEVRPFAGMNSCWESIAEISQGEVVRQDGIVLQTRAGEQLYVDVVANRYLDGSRPVIQANIRDVTDRVQADEALKQSQERFRLFVESVNDYALFQTDVNGNVTTWNSGAERLLGYNEQEIIGQPAAVIFTPEDRARGASTAEIETARREGQAEDERWHVRKDGSRFFASGVLTAMRGDNGELRGFAKIMRDATERRRAEEEIRTALRDKEVLLKEIHHRIKNNLQVIASLLGLQASYLRKSPDSKALAIVEEMGNRIRTIARIHEMLYGSPDLARIEFAAYAEKMANELFAFYSVPPDRIRLETDLHKESLTIGQAVPCGLILNELITNSLKHAYAQGRKGTIRILFKCMEEGCILEVSDDGIGLKEGVEPQSATSMGLQLVRLIVEQLQGTMSVTTDKGTRFTISFPQKDGSK